MHQVRRNTRRWHVPGDADAADAMAAMARLAGVVVRHAYDNSGREEWRVESSNPHDRHPIPRTHEIENVLHDATLAVVELGPWLVGEEATATEMTDTQSQIESLAGLTRYPSGQPTLAGEFAILGRVLDATCRLSVDGDGLLYADAATAAEAVMRRHVPRGSVTIPLVRTALSLLQDNP